MNILSWVSRRKRSSIERTASQSTQSHPKSVYAEMIKVLKRGGYALEHEGRATEWTRAPGYVAVFYTSDPSLQKRSPMEYSANDVLRDRPSRVMITDYDTGKSAILSLQKSQNEAELHVSSAEKSRQGEETGNMITESDLDAGLTKLWEMAKEAGFIYHHHSIHQSWHERRTGDTTERLDWRGRGEKIFIWYSRETQNRDPVYLDDGELSVGLNPLNPVGEEICGRIPYKPSNTIAKSEK